MALIGKEIVQSRTWVDPKSPEIPNLNYKYTFPITVYEAVKENMNDDSPNLKDAIDLIFKELAGRQPIFAGRPANYLMTFAGVAGEVGSIQMSREIPWDPKEQKHNRIPTEKAVGDLLFKLGLINEDGTIDPDGGVKTRWSDIIGRPMIYDSLGTNIDGVVIQKAVTDAINNIKSDLETLNTSVDGNFSSVNSKINSHVLNKINPHDVTIDQLGAASKDSLEFHVNNMENPHNVTTLQLNLDKVNNTSDINKPISKATQEAIDAINYLLDHMTDDVGGLNFFIDGSYDQATGTLTLVYRNGSTLSLHIPIDGLIDEILYDTDTKELVVYELGGTVKRVNVSDLFVRYIGSISSNITVEIDGSQETGNQTIKATINPQSITDSEMANDSVITRIIKDQNVTTEKIKDLSITTIKLVDESVVTEKIAGLSVVNGKIGNRAVDGRTLFSSTIADKLLGVLEIGTDPAWMQANSGMIADNAILTQHILNRSITSDKLLDLAVITEKIENSAVTSEKIHNLAIINEKIAPSTITGDKLVESPVFQGTPKILVRPEETATGNEIPDTSWVRDRMKTIEISNTNLLDRSVDGRVLFSSEVDNRALVVKKPGTNPEWGLINNGMMDDKSIDTKNIIDRSVTAIKIDYKAILSEHISPKAIQTDHINEDAVTSQKLWRSTIGNRVLAALSENGNPVYSQVTRPMIEYNAISSMQIEDRAVTLQKLQSSATSNRLLGVVLKNTDPAWMQATNGMIGDRAVNGRTLFSSSAHNVILGVSTPDVDPAWLKINGEMIMEKVLKREHIADGAIWKEHLQDKIIESRHILDWSIQSNNIAPRAITGIELFTSPIPNRVLAVTTMPYSNPNWLQVTTAMIEDRAITKEKIFQSVQPYRVLATTQAGVPPEYLMITSDFIVDDSIMPNKLVRDFILHGTPEITIRPAEDANNYQIPDTTWVRRTIANTMKNFNPEILFDTIDTDMISNHAITGDKLFTHPYGPRVLGITEANEDVEFILIEENLIVDGAVTTNKLQRDIHLLGSPIVEVRPSPYASDSQGGGRLVPDCQWVLDRIGSGGGGSGGGSPGGIPVLTPGCITTDLLSNRAVTAEKIFTSIRANRLLGVYAANDNPQYLRANNEMLDDRSVDARVLFSSSTGDRLLGVSVPGKDPAWLTVNTNMLENHIIGTDHIIDRSITSSKIEDYCITRNKLADDVLMDESRIIDGSITTRKLAKYAVENDRIADGTIKGEKLDVKIVLPAEASVQPSTAYETRAVRNTILSPNKPTGGNNGDIWFQYI